MGADVNPVEGMAFDAPVDTMDTPIEGGEDTQDVSTGADLTGGEPTTEGGEGGAEPIEAEPPKEILPKELAQAVRELRTQFPQHSKALKTMNDAYFASRAYKDVYGSVEDARADKALIQGMGGQEGLMQLLSAREAMSDFDEALDRGDENIFQDMAKASPEGFKKLVPIGMQLLRQMDTEAYQNAILVPVNQALQGSGLNGALMRAMEEMKAGTPEGVARAQRELDWMAQTIKSWRETEEGIKNRYVDPNMQKIRQEADSVRTQKAQLFDQHIQREAGMYIEDTVNRAVRQLANGRMMDRAAVQDLINTASQAIASTLSQDKFYNTNVSTLKRRGDLAAVVEFIKPQVDKLRQRLVNQAWNTRYGKTPPPMRRAAPRPAEGESAPATRAAAPVQRQTQQSSGEGKPVFINRKPDMNELDLSKDPQQLLWMTGKGYLKSTGRFITWRR